MCIDGDVSREIKEEWHIDLTNLICYFWSMKCYKYNEALFIDNDWEEKGLARGQNHLMVFKKNE